MLKIIFNHNYDSSKLLFSFPVHERQDIINNQIVYKKFFAIKISCSTVQYKEFFSAHSTK